MAFPFRHQFGGAMQALFGLNHLAGREAIFAADILAEFDQIWSATHRAHDLVELVEPVAVAMRELRQVALGKGRLLVRDRIQPKGGIGDDPCAVATRDVAVHLGAVGFDLCAIDAPKLDSFSGRADLALWLQRDALGFQTAMVDASVDVEFGQALIGDLGPAFTPALHHLGAVPLPHLPAKAVLVHRPHGQHDMGMGLGHAVLGHVPMHIEIGDHATIDEFAPNEGAGQFDALALTHLAWNGKFDLAGKLGIFPDFEGLDIVPEPLAVAPGLRRILRQHHLGMDDTALGRKIVTAIKPLVVQPRARTVGGGRHRAGARLAANDLDVKMIDHHRDRIIYTAKRTSARRISAPSLEKVSGGTIPSQAVLTTLRHCAGRSTIIFPSTLMETTMRKPRDFDAELKALDDKVRAVKSRKVQQLGELVIATGADSLSANELAGALIVLAETEEAGKREAWARRGAAFFQSRARRNATAAERNTGSASTQSDGTQPASSRKGAT